MEDPTRTEVEDKESQTKDSDSRKDSNELSQQSTVMTSFLTAGENEESLEDSPETEKKKKKKRKKKKAEMTNIVPDSTEQLLPSLVSNPEETSGNTDLRSQGPSVKEYEEPDPVKDIPTNKKRKNRKKKRKLSSVSEDELKSGDTPEKQLDNQNIHVTSAPKEAKSNSGSTVEDQGDIAVTEDEKHENDVVIKSQKECGDTVSSGFENASENLSKDSPVDTTSARKEHENAPASKKEESSISETVPSEVKPAESATIFDGDKESHVDTGPKEEVESDSSDDLSDDADNEG